VACEAPGTPILRYDSGSMVVDQIESSLVPSATGLTMDDEGYLWASDNINGKIYKINLAGTGITGDDSDGNEMAELILSSNPFSGSLTITATGFGSVVDITIYDSAGRIVRTACAENVMIWNGRNGSGVPLPAGIYTILASTDDIISIARVVLLR